MWNSSKEQGIYKIAPQFTWTFSHHLRNSAQVYIEVVRAREIIRLGNTSISSIGYLRVARCIEGMSTALGHWFRAVKRILARFDPNLSDICSRAGMTNRCYLIWKFQINADDCQEQYVEKYSNVLFGLIRTTIHYWYHGSYWSHNNNVRKWKHWSTLFESFP